MWQWSEFRRAYREARSKGGAAVVLRSRQHGLSKLANKLHNKLHDKLHNKLHTPHEPSIGIIDMPGKTGAKYGHPTNIHARWVPRDALPLTCCVLVGVQAALARIEYRWGWRIWRSPRCVRVGLEVHAPPSTRAFSTRMPYPRVCICAGHRLVGA